MAVNAAAQHLHRIVEVHTAQILESHLAVKLGKHLVATLLGREVVARRKRVAGVKTHTHARLILHAVNDIGQVPEGIAKVRALSCGILNHGRNTLGLVEGDVD